MAIPAILACAFLAVGVTSFEVPQEMDWRERGLITKVKNQGSCEGSFYFTAVGLVESHYYLKTGQVLDLSEQSSLDCSLGFNNGCNGGGVLNTIDFIRSRGVVPEEDYPYVGSLESCKMDSTQSLFKTIGFEILPKDEEKVKLTVATIGPVGVTFSGQNLESYSGGIYDDPDCQSGQSYSGIIVGYGTSDRGEDYWVVKMSYGVGWGEIGYIKVARNTGNRCGIAENAIYPIM